MSSTLYVLTPRRLNKEETTLTNESQFDVTLTYCLSQTKEKTKIYS
jgi:hypothetical protein